MTKAQKAQAYWNSRAGLGAAAGTQDLILKKLEIEAIIKYAKDGMKVLDAGCGNGITAIEMAKRCRVHVDGFDFAESMIEEARANAVAVKLKGSVRFQVADIRNLEGMSGDFDLIYTERSLINLRTWSDQKQAVERLARLLANGGIYVMCENSQDGLDKVNKLRTDVGLSEIERPWHNRYLRDAEIQACEIPGLKLRKIEYFTSTYYLLSRVVNAWLANQEGREPDYNAPVNQLACSLPPVGDLGQTRIWLWQKSGSTGPRQETKKQRHQRSRRGLGRIIKP